MEARQKINALLPEEGFTTRLAVTYRHSACRVVVPVRAFLRRLIVVRGKSHLIRLNREARKDLAAWKRCLDNFNGVSLCLTNT